MSIEVGYNSIAGGVDYRSAHKGLTILGRSDCTCDSYAILSLSLPPDGNQQKYGQKELQSSHQIVIYYSPKQVPLSGYLRKGTLG